MKKNSKNSKYSKSSIIDFFRSFIARYQRCRISMSATSVSYYLILAFFPFLIIVEWIVIFCGFDYESLLGSALIIPESSLEGIINYLDYVKNVQSTYIVYAAVIILITSLSAALRVINDCINELSSNKTSSSVIKFMASFVIAIILLFVTYFSLIIAVVLKTVITLIDRNFGTALSSVYFFSSLPLVFIFFVICLFLFFLFNKLSGGNKSLKVKCSLFVSSVLFFSSMMFSKLIECSVKYPLVYGSLSFIIVIMAWIYLCTQIILTGTCFTVTILTFKGQNFKK